MRPLLVLPLLVACSADPLDDLDVREGLNEAISPPSTSCAPGDAALIGSIGFSNVQQALDTTQTGDVVRVCAGTHEGPFFYAGPPVTVVGDTGNPEDVVLTGKGQDRILELDAGTAITLRGLTFRRGAHSYQGGAIHGSGIDQLRIDDCIFRKNRSGYAGGAISVSHSGFAAGQTPVRITDSTFLFNRADYEGGAIEIDGGWGDMRALIAGSRFVDNHSGYEGGAITSAAQGGRLSIRGSEFLGNTARYEGGAIALGAWDAFNVRIEGSFFQANHAPNHGGAVAWHSWETGRLTVIDSVAVDHEVAFGLDQSHGSGPPTGTARFVGGEIAHNDVGIDAGPEWTVKTVAVDFHDNGVDVK